MTAESTRVFGAGVHPIDLTQIDHFAATVATTHKRFYDEGMTAFEEEMSGLSDYEIPARAREFSAAQLLSWQRITVLALEAEGRIAVEDFRLGYAYEERLWPILQLPETLMYCGFIDLETGELMELPRGRNQTSKVRDLLIPMSDEAVLALVRPDLKIRSGDVTEEILELLRMPYPKGKDVAWKDGLRQDLMREFHLAA